MIQNDLPTLTSGGRRLLDKIRSIYSKIDCDAYLYIQPRIRNLIPEFILIDTERGITILEVSDWSIDYLANWNRIEFTTINNEKLDNPVFKASQYWRNNY